MHPNFIAKDTCDHDRDERTAENSYDQRRRERLPPCHHPPTRGGCGQTGISCPAYGIILAVGRILCNLFRKYFLAASDVKKEVAENRALFFKTIFSSTALVPVLEKYFLKNHARENVS